MRYAIWAQLSLCAGSARLSDIIEHFGGMRGLYEAGESGRAKSGVFTPSELKRMNETEIDSADRVILDCKRREIKLIKYDDAGFPEKLRNISAPPFVLYYRGNFIDFDKEPAVSIVGSREASEFGKKSSTALAYRFARGGMTVVSGIARGCDLSAHKGTLMAQGRGVAVLPCGHDNSYTRSSSPVLKKLLKDGLVISEYPPTEPVYKSNFKVRNRLLAGLSESTVVVEAGHPSGAIMTANYAAEQGKEVFVIPGNPTDPHYKGSNKLLSDGARILLDAHDVFDEYSFTYNDKIDTKKAFAPRESRKSPVKSKLSEKNLPETLSKNAKIVYNYLVKEIFTADDLLGHGVDGAQITAALGELEIYGIVTALPGGRYKLN